ncbi:hypothetical protein [Embleya sp. NPDC005575]|uniref:hypothetical protein n=1 Tax=Embleya sp. NPDC005575 TaxID=3156892 RepID=UPI0033BD891F
MQVSRVVGEEQTARAQRVVDAAVGRFDGGIAVRDVGRAESGQDRVERGRVDVEGQVVSLRRGHRHEVEGELLVDPDAGTKWPCAPAGGSSARPMTVAKKWAAAR